MILKAWCVFLIGSCANILGGPAAAVDFPGPPPGKAEARQVDKLVNNLENGLLTLENSVIAASWHIHDGQLRPAGLTNKLTGDRYDQSGAELFRLATKPAEAGPAGVVVGIRLEADKVVALASRNGTAWTELVSFPRAEFPGEPKLVRLGKMNLKAESKNNPGDLGVPGEAIITDVAPLPTSIPSGRATIKAKAHEALTSEFSFPAGTTN